MTDVRPPVAVDYTFLLREFVEGDPEEALLGAYQLGRRAVEANIGLLEVVTAYHLALAQAVAEAGCDAERTNLVERAGQLLGESLVSFQMIHAGYHDANRALRETHARFQAILDHTPAIVALKTLDGRYLLVNKRFEQLFGIPAPTVAGRTDLDLFGDSPLRRMFERSTAGLRLREAESFEDTIDWGDGPRTFLTIRVFIPDARGVPSSICTISTEITKRVHAEQDVRAGRRRADAANAAKSEFLSRMSHELRTPLNAVLGFGQLLQLEDLTDDQGQYADDIVAAGRHLLNLINEVLDISGIEAGRSNLTIGPVDLRSTVNAAIDLIRPAAAERSITVDAIDLPFAVVLADRQRLMQVLLNLLSNAVKYNREGGSIQVTGFRGDPAGCGVAVRDTGRGIDPARLDQVFAPFERLGAEYTDIEGTGIGLALTKGLVEQMGGMIRVESEPDRGSTFTIELPTVAASLSPVPEAPDESEAISPEQTVLDVLYIEDSATSVKLMQHILGLRPNVSLLSAMQARRGVDLALSHPPDLVLLDLNLPDGNGQGVLRKLRGDDRTAQVTVAVISADATPGAHEDLLDQGADYYLTKPIDVDEILALVDDLSLRKLEHPGSGPGPDSD